MTEIKRDVWVYVGDEDSEIVRVRTPATDMTEQEMEILRSMIFSYLKLCRERRGRGE